MLVKKKGTTETFFWDVWRRSASHRRRPCLVLAALWLRAIRSPKRQENHFKNHWFTTATGNRHQYLLLQEQGSWHPKGPLSPSAQPAVLLMYITIFVIKIVIMSIWIIFIFWLLFLLLVLLFVSPVSCLLCSTCLCSLSSTLRVNFSQCYLWRRDELCPQLQSFYFWTCKFTLEAGCFCPGTSGRTVFKTPAWGCLVYVGSLQAFQVPLSPNIHIGLTGRFKWIWMYESE